MHAEIAYDGRVLNELATLGFYHEDSAHGVTLRSASLVAPVVVVGGGE